MDILFQMPLHTCDLLLPASPGAGMCRFANRQTVASVGGRTCTNRTTAGLLCTAAKPLFELTCSTSSENESPRRNGMQCKAANRRFLTNLPATLSGWITFPRRLFGSYDALSGFSLGDQPARTKSRWLDSQYGWRLLSSQSAVSSGSRGPDRWGPLTGSGK
jgi:hypothetical protein